MYYPWVISSVPVSHILSTRESYPQYLWVISSVPVRICSTCESYPQYPLRVCSTCEDMQYPWGKFHSFFIHINLLTGNEDMTHGYWWYDSRYCISSRVLRIWLTGTEDMTRGYCISSQVLRIWLTGTDYMTHGYCISSRVLRIWLTGTAYPHGYWGYDSRVMHTLTGTDDMTHG